MTIKQNALAEIKDINENSPVIFEANFDEENPECLRISIGKEVRIVKYTDIFSMMFMLATKEQQAKMVPVKQELGYEYMKQIQIKCKNDMKAGDILAVNVKIHVPTVIEESILRDKENGKLSTGDPVTANKEMGI